MCQIYTLPESTNMPGYEGTFCIKWKKRYFNEFNTKLETKFAEMEKKINRLEKGCNKM